MSRSKAKDHILLDVFNLGYSLCLIGVSGSGGYYASTLFDSLFLKFSLGALVSFVVFSAIPALIYFFLPKIKEGRHSFPSSRDSMIWILKFYIKKPITVPLVSNSILTIHFWSYTILRLLRCKLDTSFQLAANIEIRDPEFVELSPGVTIGSDTILAPHRMTKKALELFKIKLGENCSIGAFNLIALGCEVGDGTVVGTKTLIGPHVKIGKSCIIGDNVTIEEGSTIGDKVIIKSHSFIEKNTVIPSRTVVDKSHEL